MTRLLETWPNRACQRVRSLWNSVVGAAETIPGGPAVTDGSEAIVGFVVWNSDRTVA